jgi:hypothetical protein
MSSKPLPQASIPESPALPELTIERRMLSASELSWQPRADHVAMQIPYEPLRRLKDELERREGMSLQSRPDASLLVLNPQELKILRTRLGLEEIHQFIAKTELQKIPYRPLCLGIMRHEEGSQKLRTYFLTVESQGIKDLRRQLSRRFVEKGGKPHSFQPDAYQARITVAYNQRDLLREEALSSSNNPCAYRLSWNTQPTEEARPSAKPWR